MYMYEASICMWVVYALHHVYYWRGVKFGKVLTIRQTSKLKSSPNFPAIIWYTLLISLDVNKTCKDHFRTMTILFGVNKVMPHAYIVHTHTYMHIHTLSHTHIPTCAHTRLTQTLTHHTHHTCTYTHTNRVSIYELPWPILKTHVCGVVTVSEEEIITTMKLVGHSLMSQPTLCQ